jgi:hypothetical protein
MAITGVPQGDKPHCLRHSVAAILRIHPDDLPETDVDDPDWVVKFTRATHAGLGVKIKSFWPDQRPSPKEPWIAIIVPCEDAVSLHPVVAEGPWMEWDPSGRFPRRRPVATLRVIVGLTVKARADA